MSWKLLGGLKKSVEDGKDIFECSIWQTELLKHKLLNNQERQPTLSSPLGSTRLG